ncbi:thiopeptide-type bacteriocin biosynthesis protein [Microbacterium sp. p3-SID338]|uniref:thiopeptide-type bacteriocin biosynthesis protein n=1 Tax=Microbacterium sp. p3-SID338 TaxID=2916214 RepID=UPI0037C52B80
MLRTQRRAESGDPEEEVWVYWKLYPMSPSEIDGCILSALSHVHAEVPAIGQWHYLRIVDADGLHIRVRFEVPRRAADASVMTFERLSTLTPAADCGPWRPIRPHPDSTISGRDRRIVQWRTYVPEVNKWGAREALGRAHNTFTHSSRFAAAVLPDVSDPRDRSLVAMSLMSGLVKALPIDGLTRDKFLRQHAAWWDPARSLENRSESDSATMRRVLRRSPAALTRLSRAIDAARLHGEQIAEASLHARGDRSPLYLAHQHAHLTINRLGIHGTDEAWICHLVRAQETEPGR